MKTERACALRRGIRGHRLSCCEARSQIPRPGTSTLFGLAPQLIPLRCRERLELRPASPGKGLHEPEASLKLGIRLAQRLLGVDVQVQSPVGDRKEQIAQL